jgi:hypothetical protein
LGLYENKLFIGLAEYCQFYLRMLRVFRETRPTAAQLAEAVRADWTKDSRGKEGMNKQDFTDSIYQLALNWEGKTDLGTVPEVGAFTVEAQRKYLQDLHDRVFSISTEELNQFVSTMTGASATSLFNLIAGQQTPLVSATPEKPSSESQRQPSTMRITVKMPAPRADMSEDDSRGGGGGERLFVTAATVRAACSAAAAVAHAAGIYAQQVSTQASSSCAAGLPLKAQISQIINGTSQQQQQRQQQQHRWTADTETRPNR